MRVLAAARYVELNPVRAGLVPAAAEELRDMRRHSRTGRPLGSTPFVERLERILGRALTPKKPGRNCRVPKQP